MELDQEPLFAFQTGTPLLGSLRMLLTLFRSPLSGYIPMRLLNSCFRLRHVFEVRRRVQDAKLKSFAMRKMEQELWAEFLVVA